MPRSDVGARLLQSTEEWPNGWAYEERDIAFGRELVAVMLPFLRSLVEQGLSETSIRRHFGNAALLGSESVRRVQMFPEERRKGPRHCLLEQIDEEGGPLCHDIDTDEQQQRSFDGTCRKIHRFLVASAPFDSRQSPEARKSRRKRR
jgi:hypothetical protein